MSNRKFLYFYSNKCQYCKRFTDVLNKSTVRSNFTKICVDTPGLRLPSYLKAVPTVQIYENDRRHVLADKHAFEWISQYSKAPEETQAFNLGEMGSSSLSDCFSFLDDKNDDVAGTPFKKDCAFLQQLDSFYITTPDEDSDGKVSGGIGNLKSGGGGRGGGMGGDGGMGGGGSGRPVSKLEMLQRQREQDVPRRGNGPPPKAPNFSQSSLGGAFSKNEMEMARETMSQKKYDSIIEQRNRDVPRGRVPSRAPDFTSASFKSQYVTPEMRSQAQRQINRQVRPINYRNVMKKAPKINRPQGQPNFHYSSRYQPTRTI